MSRLELTLLGTPQISIDGAPVNDFVMRKAEAMLIYLAVNQRTHARTALAGLFWPDVADDYASNSLRRVLPNLRKLVGSYLQIDRQTVSFDKQSPYWLDVEIFTTTLAPFAQETSSIAVDFDRLAQALTLYRGDFLEGFYLHDAPAFEEWALFQREQLRLLALRGLTRLVDFYIAQGSHAAGLAATQRLLAIEPWAESAHFQQMTLLAQTGQRAAALAQYERCRDLLASEFGAQPLPSLTALYHQIRAGEYPSPLQTASSADLKSLSDTIVARQGERVALALPQFPAVTSSLPRVPDALKVDWGDPPRVGDFYGREAELRQLSQWLLEDQCVLVTVLGTGGVGKTTLTAYWVQLLAQGLPPAHSSASAPFTRMIWRSLRNAPPLEAILRMWLQTLTDQQLTALPSTVDEQLSRLFTYLRQQRCLLVLDNWESILQAGDASGGYLPGYESYGLLLQQISQHRHQSCLLLTSREANLDLIRLGRDYPVVRALSLQGMPVAAGMALLKAAGLKTHERSLSALVQRYSGNPLALKLVAETVLGYYQGDSTFFLQQETAVFDDIRHILAQQMARVSPMEWAILLWLAIEREPVAARQLQGNFVQPPSHSALLSALRALHRRSLVEQTLIHQRSGEETVHFGLQNVVLEYITERLRETISDELSRETLDYFLRFALVKAQATDYMREAQVQLILHPLAQHLQNAYGKAGVARKLQQLLLKLRADFAGAPGYGAANLLHLAFHLAIPVIGWDFSQLALWQADLRNRRLRAVNFAQADFVNTALMEKFQAILAVAFSPDGAVVAAGGASGDVYLWRVQDGQLLALCSGRGRWVWAVAFSPDGYTLASATADGTITLWDITDLTRAKANAAAALPWPTFLSAHTDAVFGLAFSPDGRQLASVSADHTVILWDVARKEETRTLQGHTASIYAVAYHPSGSYLVSAGRDQTIRLWDLATGQCRQILDRHQALITQLCFSADGAWLFSGSTDGVVYVWQMQLQAQPHALLLHFHHELVGEPTEIVALALSPHGQMVAVNGPDATIRLRQQETGVLVRTLAGHRETVQALAFSANGQLLVSGAWDQSVRFWDVATGYPLRTLQGYTNEVTALALSPKGSTLVSATTDATLALWNLSTRQLTYTQQTDATSSLAFHPSENLVAVGGDQIIGLYTFANDQLALRQSLRGHTDEIVALAFHPAGLLLASGSADCTLRLWDSAAGAIRQVLQAHNRTVQAIAFRPNGQMLISGDDDGHVWLWQPTPGDERQWLQTKLGEIPGGVTTLAFSPDGALLAGAGPDHTIFLWRMMDAALFATLQTPVHSTLYVLAFNPTCAGNRLELVSSSGNGAICCWEIELATGAQRLCYMRKEHQRSVRALLFTPDGQTLISGSADETIKVWDVKTGDCLATLNLEQPYQGMNITGATGLTPAQQTALKALGASD